MRHAIALGAAGCLLVVGGCAAGPSRKSAADGPVSRCSVSSCFNQRDIRGYDVLGPHTLVVYTGRQRCPFLVTLRGPHCGIGVGPTIAFLSPRRENPLAAATIPRILSGDDPVPPGGPSFGLDPSRSAGRIFDQPSRICNMAPNTIAYAGIMPVGEETPVDVVPGLTYACVLEQVHSLTDNQLIELLVKRKAAPPPPPVGQGSLSVPKQPPAGGASAPTGANQDGQPASGASSQSSDNGAPSAPPPH